jgi:hypothetical protein
MIKISQKSLGVMCAKTIETDPPMVGAVARPRLEQLRAIPFIAPSDDLLGGALLVIMESGLFLESCQPRIVKIAELVLTPMLDLLECKRGLEGP